MPSQFFVLFCEIIGRFLSVCFRSRLLCSSGIPLTVVQTISKCQEASLDILKFLNDTTFRRLKQKELLGRNWTAGPVLTTPERFENWDFTPFTLGRRNLKTQSTITSQFECVFDGKLDQGKHMTPSLSKSSFFKIKCFYVHTQFSNSFGLKSVFGKLGFQEYCGR